MIEPKPMPETAPELRVYLDTLDITSENIGEIRRSLFKDYMNGWNALVREMTAERENLKRAVGQVSANFAASIQAAAGCDSGFDVPAAPSKVRLSAELEAMAPPTVHGPVKCNWPTGCENKGVYRRNSSPHFHLCEAHFLGQVEGGHTDGAQWTCLRDAERREHAEVSAAIKRQFPEATDQDIAGARIDALHEQSELAEMAAEDREKRRNQAADELRAKGCPCVDAGEVVPGCPVHKPQNENSALVYRPTFMQRVRNRFFRRGYCEHPPVPEPLEETDCLVTITNVRVSLRDRLRLLITGRASFEIRTARTKEGPTFSNAAFSVGPWRWLLDPEEKAEWDKLEVAMRADRLARIEAKRAAERGLW